MTAAYHGKLFYKGVLILIYVGLGIMVENIMAFVLTICTVQLHVFELSSTAYYLAGLSSSALFFLLVILCVLHPFRKTPFTKPPLQHSMASSWNALFLVLLSITLTMSSAKKGQGAEKEFSLETQLRDADYYFNNQCDENGFKPFDTLLKPSINGNILTLPSVRQTPGKMENVILKIDFVQGKIISKTVNGSGENILS